jgi:heat shock protein HtpX
MSNVKVFVLLAGMVALFGVVGGMLGGHNGMLLALAISAVMSFVMYFNSGKMALRAYGAQVVTREQAPELYDMVDRLRQRAGLPMPQVAIAPHQQPNAFATGRNAEHAVVCVTRGLMDLVNRDEAEGVIAHELAPLAQVNPLSAFRGGIATLFVTHPPTAERIARLQQIARGEPPG